jgi:DUF1680 family protein
MAVHLYGANETTLAVSGNRVGVRQETEYPWDGLIRLELSPAKPASFRVLLRVPGWCRRFSLSINRRRVSDPRLRKGYLSLERTWKAGDRIELRLEMPVERVESHPSVRENCGKVALQRGPIVYCLESCDNGKDLADISLPDEAPLSLKPGKIAGSKIPFIHGKGHRRERRGWSDRLYRSDLSPLRPVNLKAVPYFMWDNRGDGGEMCVWIRRG